MTTTTLTPSKLTAAEARELTDDIRTDVENLWTKIERAYAEGAWSALGYESWDAYTSAEFDTVHLRLPKAERAEVVASMREAGMTIREIASGTGMSVGTVSQTVKPPMFKNEPALAAANERALLAAAVRAKMQTDPAFVTPQLADDVHFERMLDRARALDPALPRFILDMFDDDYEPPTARTYAERADVLRLEYLATAEILTWQMEDILDQIVDGDTKRAESLLRQLAFVIQRLHEHLGLDDE